MHTTSAVHGVLVTFRRPAELAVTLRRLAEQTRPLDTLAVIDNDSDPRIKHLVDSVKIPAEVTYLPTAENLGPAGALALGANHILHHAGDADWVMFFDDDDPPRTASTVAAIVAFAERMRQVDQTTAAVGLVGARFDFRTGLTVRVPDDALRGPVPVDYVGGGQMPCYLAGVMREVGVPEPCLFFGFDDLEYGLRLRTAGHRLYVDGEKWAGERFDRGRTGLDRRPSKHVRPLGWRDYYSTRNLVWILRRHRRHRAAARFLALRVVAKAAYNSVRSPRLAWRHLNLGARAGLDAYRGRMGRTVEPS
jgi:glycosyltransferase involved in cell wall biosynthesis